MCGLPTLLIAGGLTTGIYVSESHKPNIVTFLVDDMGTMARTLHYLENQHIKHIPLHSKGVKRSEYKGGVRTVFIASWQSSNQIILSKKANNREQGNTTSNRHSNRYIANSSVPCE